MENLPKETRRKAKETCMEKRVQGNSKLTSRQGRCLGQGKRTGINEMAEWDKVLTTKPDDANSIPVGV